MDTLTWLLATGNQGKVRELKPLIEAQVSRLVSLKDMGIEADCPETGSSFLENARQKAMFYQRESGLPVLADDSGLEVDALNGAPGIHSARFGGLPNHKAKRAYLLDLMSDVDDAFRTARFFCAAVYYDGKVMLDATGTMEGFIGHQERGEHGFGYDSIFHITWNGPTNAEIDLATKNACSHRAKAFRGLLKNIENRL